jgi:hypothetical protein
LKRNYHGCAICNSTWGNLWEEVDGERLFFCCEICSVQYRGLLDRIKQNTGWGQMDSIVIAGDRRGRTCEVMAGEERARFSFSFNSDGNVLRFQRTDSTPPAVR